MNETPKDDLFDSDPFFNPPAPPPPTPVEPEPPKPEPEVSSFPVGEFEIQPEPPVHTTAEERLLNTIVGDTPDSPQTDESAVSRQELEALRTELENACSETQKAEAARDRARQDLQILKTRFSSLESDLATVRSEAASAHQAHTQAEARHAEAEKQWTEKLSQLRNMLEEVEDIRDELASKRVPKLLFIGTLAAGIITTAGAYFLGLNQAPAHDEATPPPPSAAIAAPVPPPLLAPIAPPPVTWPSIGNGRWTTTTSNRELKVIFTNGTFTRGIELSIEAKQDLRAIATAIKAQGSRFRIEVEGHTDATKGSNNKTSAANNQALGLARAKAAASYLNKQGGLPASLISTSSAGENNPPYPNTTPENQKKNRTVILKIMANTP